MTDTHHIQVSVEDGTKAKEEYGVNRKVNVSLSADTEDFDRIEAITEHLSNLANRQVSKLLGRVSPPDLKVVGGTEAPAETPEATAPARRTRRTAAQIEADNAAKAKPAADPAAVTDDAPAADDFQIEGDATPAEDTAAAADDFSIEPEETSEEISDAALNAAVQRKNAELSDPEAIRAVIKGYNPDPTKAFQLREIPQAKRAEFISKLNELKKASA